MRVFRALAPAAVLLLALLPGRALALHPTPTPSAFPVLGPNVTTGALPGGGDFIVRRSAAVPVAAVELWFRAPSTGFGATPVPSLARLATEVVVASKPITGKSLGALVDDLGGHLSISVYADSVSVSALVPSPNAAQVVRAMTTAFFAPVVTDDGFQLAQRSVGEQALLESFSADTITRQTVFSALFTGGPAHYPALGDAQGVVNIPVDNVRSFAQRAFRSQNAVLVVNGAVDASIVDAAVAGRVSGSDENSNAVPEPAVSSTVTTSVQSVIHPLDQTGGGFGWVGPPITNEREATALDFIADYLFRPDVGLVTRELADSQPDAEVSGQFITLHDPGVFLVNFTGQNTAAIESAVAAGITNMHEPLEHTQFAVALDAFEYHLLSDLQTPLSVADNFGWYTVEGDAAYAPGADGDAGAYFRAAHALTPQFVAEVARKYLGKPGATVVLAPQSPAPAAQKGPSS